MLNSVITFTEPGIAKLLQEPVVFDPAEGKVLVETLYTAVSAGTERANLLGYSMGGSVLFPRVLGYSGVGIVREIGVGVTRVKVGDRVIVHFGQHRKYNVMNEEALFPLRPEISDQQAALLVISEFPIEGVRKTRLEIGESVLVMGLGILGLMAIQFAKLAGAVPVIAVDPNPERRAMAMEYGADYALDPTDTDALVANVKELTDGKGADVCIDVVGIAAATNQAFRCMNRFGRVALLGCTRYPGEYDFYHDVHYPGLTLIGAHTEARPKYESRPGNWTALDDNLAVQKLIAAGRLDLTRMIHEIHTPDECGEVYARLADYKDFPIGVLFDWTKMA